MWWAPIASFFNGLWGYVLLGVACVAAGAYGCYRIEEPKILAVQLADAKDYAAALDLQRRAQKAADDASLKAAVAEAEAQQKIVVRMITLTKEIPAHVSNDSHCITYGLVRVLNAAAGQTSVDAVPGTSGKPDVACAPVTWRSFAEDITDDYGHANANAEELTALQGWVASQRTITP